jgi:hypothetical protein
MKSWWCAVSAIGGRAVSSTLAPAASSALTATAKRSRMLASI